MGGPEYAQDDHTGNERGDWMSKTFLQANYGTIDDGTEKGISMANSGCGPTALADIIYNIDKDITPRKVAKWLYNNGYFSSAGTTRTGITRAIAKYDMQSLYYTPEHTGNTYWNDALQLLKASREASVWAVALAVGRSNGGKDNYWTSGGHFIAITDYDATSGKIYVRDPANRRTGYQDPDQLKYDCNCMWIITRKG
jgi:hypothetical protein